MTFRIILDVAAGVALACVLLTILILDRIGLAGTPEQNAPGQRAQTSSLLADPRIAKQIQVIGNVERLEKLKVIRLTSKATFADTPNVNDLTLSWCWEPAIVIRAQEDNSEQARRFRALPDLGRQFTGEALLLESKGGLDFSSDAELERRYDEEFRGVIARKEDESLFSTVVLLEGKRAYRVFNKRLAVPMQPARSTAMRNLCFALSISNLIPVRRHGFEIEPGEKTVEVKGKKCKQFTVKDKDGASLQFYFDEQTNLLMKISHRGHDPKGFRQEILWEHHFSDYREVEGIKQWHHLEAHNDGQPFATLDVTKVEFFDNVLPELRRPGK